MVPADGLFTGACTEAVCEGHEGVPEPEPCALKEVTLAQPAAGPTGQITFVVVSDYPLLALLVNG